MPDREAHSKPASLPGAPSRDDSRDDTACGFCGDPISPGETSRHHIASSPTDRTGRVHEKCIHERAIVRAAMRRPNIS
jgi:hypothetical protein